MIRIDLPHLNWSNGNEIPHELIEVCAYLKWEKRCREYNMEFHGTHEQDWLEAEQELRETWTELTVREMFEFAERVEQCWFMLSEAAIEERAYYLSRRKPLSDMDEVWQEARVQEWNFQFANVFLSFRQSVRNRLRCN